MPEKINFPDLEAVLYRHHERNIRISPSPNNRASSIGSECLRMLVYNRIAWQVKEKPSIDLQFIFDEGRLHERQIIIELQEEQLEVVEQQVSGFDEGTGLSWHLDAVVHTDAGRFPLEVKSCAGHIYDALSKYGRDEFKKAMDELGVFYPWLRNYLAQILTYLNGRKLEAGIVLFKGKQNGRPKQFNVIASEHSAFFDDVVSKSKKIDGLVKELGEKKLDATGADKAGLLPERIADPDLCRKCDFRFVCLPDVDFGKPLSLLTDKLLEKKIDRWYKYQLIAKEFDDLTEEINLAVKGKANTIVGRFHVDGKADKRGTWRKSISVITDEDRVKLEEESRRLVAALNGKEKK